MINKIKIERFKAFHESFEIPLAGQNLLLYGENGAGKSSIYESLKVVFFKSKMQSHITGTSIEDRQQLTQDFWSEFNNKIDNQSFSIEINDLEYNVFDTSIYEIFMISRSEFAFGNSLYLEDLISNFYFSIDDVANVCENVYTHLEEAVNQTLQIFNEHIKIEINKEENYSIKIIDPVKNLESRLEIKRFFNEAKINLITILLLLHIAWFTKEPSKKKVIVLDDFITSLDSSNRLFIMRFILDKFLDAQILIFTHNVSFYNLAMFMINSSSHHLQNWRFANLYEINNCHKLYIKSEIEKVEHIRNDYNLLTSPTSSGDIISIGNRIRKKFEILLYEHSKLLMVGAVEDSNKLVDRILKGSAVYFKEGKTASDLIDNLENILANPNQFDINRNLSRKINEYKNENFINFQKIIRELKLYQKVTMHPLSHGVIGMPTFTTAEIQQSLKLLEKMEAYIDRMSDGNVSTV